MQPTNTHAHILAIVFAICTYASTAHAQRAVADEAALSVVSSNNELTYRMARPIGDGPFPVVVFANNCQGYDGYAEIQRGYYRHTSRLVKEGYAVIWNDYFKSKGFSNCQKVESRVWAEDILRTAEWARRQPWAKDAPVNFIGFSYGASMVPMMLNDAERAPKAFAKLIMMYPSCDTDGFGPWKASVPVLHLVGGKDSRTNSYSYCNSVVLRTQDKSSYQSIEYLGAYHGFDLYDEGSRAISGDDNGSPSAKASIAAWRQWIEFLQK